MRKFILPLSLILFLLSSISAFGAVTFVADSEVKVASGTQISIPMPAGWAVGNVLIACIVKDDDDAITPPAGWIVIQNVNSGTAMRLWTGYRVAEAGDGNQIWTGDSEAYYGVILCYSGNDTSSPIKASGSSTGTTDAPIAPSVAFTDLEAGSLVLQVFGADSNDDPYTVPSQLASHFNDLVNAATGCGGAGGDKSATKGWTSPTGFSDPDNKWSPEADAYDEDVTSNAYHAGILAETWSSYLELTINAISCNAVRFYATYSSTYINQISVDVYYSSGWHTIYTGAFADKEWVEKAIGSTETVTKMRMKFYNNNVSDTYGASLWEADFWEIPIGGDGNTGTATFGMGAAEEWVGVTAVIEAAAAAGITWNTKTITKWNTKTITKFNTK